MALAPPTPLVTTICFPPAPYQAVDIGGGLHQELTASPVLVPDDHNMCNFALNPVLLPNVAEIVAKVRLELSFDGIVWSPKPNGETVWPWGVFPLGFTMGGALIRNIDGSPQGKTGINFALPPAIGRRLRAIFIPIQNLSASVEVTTRANGSSI